MMRSFKEQLYLLQHLEYPEFAMVHLQWFTCDELLAMATKNNCCIILYELSLEGLWNFENNSENHLMRIGCGVKGSQVNPDCWWS